MSDVPTNAAGPGHKDRARTETPTAPKLTGDATAGVRRGLDPAGAPPAMTKAERTELQRVVRLNGRVLRDQVNALKAGRLAELEAELSAMYPRHDPRWRTITAEAERLIDELDGQLAELCAAEGLRPEFRPGLSLGWYSRGENADADRRAELRKLGERRIDEAAKRALAEVTAWEASAATDLVARGLTTAAAEEWLAAMPTAEGILPAITVAELETGRTLKVVR